MKKYFKKFLIFLLLVVPFSLLVVKADSGWDSDFDSGGGDSWSSSDSSWDSSSSSGSYSSEGDPFFTLVFIIIIIIVIYSLSMHKNTNGNTNIVDDIMEISEEELKKYLPDETLASIKKKLFDKFVDIQNAWMEFDYEALKKLCTDELYNSYVSQLDTLKLKFGKNVMSSFELLRGNVVGISVADNVISINVRMKITFFDYVINTNTNEVIRGQKEYRLVNNYDMTFVIANDISNLPDKCPNCGAPLEGNASYTCPYCDSPIVKSSGDYVLSKKTNINK